jgi:hypothetical protein
MGFQNMFYPMGRSYWTCLGRLVPEVEYPAGSGNSFSAGAVWVGGVKGADTLVSVTWGVENSSPWNFEFAPPAWPEGAIREYTSREELPPDPESTCPLVLHSDVAISEHDIVMKYLDTLTDPNYIMSDHLETRQHAPLGIEITQRNYAWSHPYAEDFIIAEFVVKQLHEFGGELKLETIRNAYFGIMVRSIAYHFDGIEVDQREGIRSAPLVGLIRVAPLSEYFSFPDTLNALWCADNDGDPEGAVYFGSNSVTPVWGIRFIGGAVESDRLGFNWWSHDHYDWGPVKRTSKVQFVKGNPGAPYTDRAKYTMMAEAEIDYPQVEAAMNHELEGWYPPYDPGAAVDMADGLRTLSLLSIGPFDLHPGDSEVIALAIVGGENFHRYPSNFQQYFDPKDPEPYMQRLDFTDFIKNCQRAAWLYDSPGVDTDGDGYRGDYFVSGEDTVYYRGDGVRDLKGPPAPNAPHLRFTSAEGQVTIHWNGKRTETELDPFTNRADFEGYRLYMSRTGRRQDYAMLTQRDLLNYARYTWNKKKEKWEFKDPPYTLDSLKKLYDSISTIRHGYEFHPDSFDVALVEKALLVEWLDPNDPSILDTFFYYFGPYDANQTPNDKILAQTVEVGIPVTGVIRKVYPDSKIEDTLYRDDGTPFVPYYEYEYVIDHLQLAEPVFFALTAFDHGDPISGLEPLESSVTLNAQEVWAINSAEVVKSTRPKPGVYPNPYKFSEYYNAQGWENPRGLEPDPERARKVTFFNVPDTCVVSIWSIDGDLVRRIEHRENPSNSQASVVIWNLITRNTQAVKTGIYLYSIESRFGVDTGKLVIIK